MKSLLGFSDDRKNVLIVDDSLFVRRKLEELIGDFDRFSVVGTASNGQEALDLLSEESVDVMTLDVYMPEMNGLETLRALKQRDQDVPVLMISRATTEESRETTRALSLGAADAIAKPGGDDEARLGDLRETLREHLVMLSDSNDREDAVAEDVRTPSDSAVEEKLEEVHPEMVVIGGSTGALNVIRSILETLDASFPVPIAIVQHIAEPFLAGLPENLSVLSEMRTVGVTDPTVARPGTVYLLGDPDRHLTVRRGGSELMLRPHHDEPVHRARPSVDVLFESAERALGQDVLAVLLSGMGEDGARGMKKLQEAGALCVTQDQTSSVVHGMPSSAVEREAVDAVASAEELPALIRDWIAQSRTGS